MRAGDEVQVRLINKIDENSASVQIISDDKLATLKIKGRLRIKQDGTGLFKTMQKPARLHLAMLILANIALPQTPQKNIYGSFIPYITSRQRLSVKISAY